MPPRIRTIKPEFWTDQMIQRQELGVRLTYIGLWSHADDAGRLEGDQALLRSRIHPGDVKVTQRVFDRWLDQLEQVGRIRRYHVDGQPFMDIPRFRKHQRIDRAQPSVIPPYEAAIDTGEDPPFVDRSTNGTRSSVDEDTSVTR